MLIPWVGGSSPPLDKKSGDGYAMGDKGYVAQLVRASDF